MRPEIKIDFKLKSILREVDWEGKYPDVKKKDIDIQEFIEDLNTELRRLENNRLITVAGSGISEKDRIKRAFNKPTFGAKGEFLKPEIDIEDIKRQIIKRPKSIFSQGNRKAKKTTAGGTQETWITGVPALWGVIFDEEENKFVYVNTCPGAGSCMINCYAKKGQFDINDDVVRKATNRLNFLMNDPDGYYEKALAELEKIAKKLQAEGVSLKVRWNESGDFFSNTYFNIVKQVTKELQLRGYDIASYAYTKMGDLAKLGDEALKVSFSTNANQRERNKIDVGMDRFSQMVPLDMFRRGIFVKKGMHIQVDDNGKPIFLEKNSKKKLKQMIFDEYKDEFNLDYGKLVYQDELPARPGEWNKYVVIMLPKGDTDIGAQRPDVRGLFILEH